MLALSGLLSAMAASGYRQHLHAAKRAEGFTHLKGVYAAQSAHRFEHREYAPDFDALGFAVESGRVLDPHTIRATHYTYTVHAFPYEDNARGNFQAVATADLDKSDAMLDVLLIENDLTVVE